MTRQEFEEIVKTLEKITFKIYDNTLAYGNKVQLQESQACKNWKRVLAFANFYGINTKGIEK